VNADRALAISAVAVAVSLSGCMSEPQVAPAPARRLPPPPAAPAQALPPASIPWSAQAVPDAVPKIEPRSRYGNPPFYEVFGRRYYVLSSSSAYVERGVASWYGPGFHEIRTSTREPYDMYGMTAAHKTLPLPAYVRVTNLQNGRSVVVRVNDRGPFVNNRIIDLSYTAAAKLDMLRNGTAMVEVRSIDPSIPAGAPVATPGSAVLAMAPAAAPPAAPAAATPTPIAAPVAAPIAAAGAASNPTAAAAPNPVATGTPVTAPASPPAAAIASTTAAIGADSVPPPSAAAPAPSTAPVVAAPTAMPPPLFVQAGAFADPVNADRLAGKLRGGGFGKVFVRDDVIAGRKMYRVRIGPVPDVPEFDRIVAALEKSGVHDAHLALD
jgi:rare lipoprotein A